MTPSDIRALRIEKGYDTAAAGTAYAESFGGVVANCIRNGQRCAAGKFKIARHAENWLRGRR